MNKIIKYVKDIVIKSVLILFLIIIATGSIVTTSAKEYKLITQFGEVVRIETEPGASFKIPFIQGTLSVPNYKMIADLYPSNVTTKDKKVMTVDSFVIWRISDPVKYLSSLNASLENAENRLENVVYNSVKTVLSRTDQEEIISGRDGLIATTITENIGNAMESYGIEILSVETKKLDLPDSNKEAVYQRMISERNNIAAGYTANGQYESNLIKNETDRNVTETIAKAEAEAEEIKAAGEAEYMRVLSNAYNDESKADFYNYVRSLDALKSSLKGKNKTVILDENSELSKILSGN